MSDHENTPRDAQCNLLTLPIAGLVAGQLYNQDANTTYFHQVVLIVEKCSYGPEKKALQD